MGQRLVIPDGGPPADLGEGSIVFVGKDTVILRYGGFTILSDPTFLHHGDHVHLGYGLTPRGPTEPPLGIEPLPPVDFVLLSHMHEDHMDRVVERELDRRLPVLTTPRAAKTLRQKGFATARGLATWETISVERADVSVRVTSLPALQHGPEAVDLFLPDAMGSMLEFARQGEVGLRLYVSGDTVFHEDLRQIRRRYPGIDLALFHLGGTRVLGVLATTDAEQAVTVLRLIGPRTAVSTHCDDPHAFEPLRDFASAVRQAGLEAHVHHVAHGDSYAFRTSDLRALPAISRGSPDSVAPLRQTTLAARAHLAHALGAIAGVRSAAETQRTEP